MEDILKEILEEIKLLTVATKSESLKKFYNEFLTSDLRKQMYEAFDGLRTLPEISKDIGCKLNTLQVFAQSLVENDLVKAETKGNARVLDKSVTKIALYYASKSLEEEK